MQTYSSPDDPIFYLLHAFVDFTWAVWQDCHDYDLEPFWGYSEEHYVGTHDATSWTGPSLIDSKLEFGVLAATSWAKFRRTFLSPFSFFICILFGFGFDFVAIKLED